MMFTPADLAVMERVRAVWNPDNLCNPGKVLPERSACAEVAKWPQMVDKVLGQGEAR
jgi:glycolate oxidase